MFQALVENNTKIEENHIRVDSCSGGSKPKVDSRKTLFLGNLPFNIEEQKVREFFEQFGTILSVRVIRDKKTQVGKGMCNTFHYLYYSIFGLLLIMIFFRFWIC